MGGQIFIDYDIAEGAVAEKGHDVEGMGVYKGSGEDLGFEGLGLAEEVECCGEVAELDFPLVEYIKRCISILVNSL